MVGSCRIGTRFTAHLVFKIDSLKRDLRDSKLSPFNVALAPTIVKNKGLCASIWGTDSWYLDGWYLQRSEETLKPIRKRCSGSGGILRR